MDHALIRVRAARSAKDIADLDKSRLRALAEFLRFELDSKDMPEEVSFQAFLSHRPADVSYSLEIDLRTVLSDLPSFKQWLKSQRMAFKEKVARLITTIEEYSWTIEESLFPSVIPKEEFTILHELLSKILSQTESALVS